MRRRIASLVSLLLLLLCVATVVLWVRSYRQAGYVYFTHQIVWQRGMLHADWAYGLLLKEGTVQFERRRDVRRDHVTAENIRSGFSGPWDWGEVNITTEGGRDVVGDVGFTDPAEHWWIFGWNQESRPFTGMSSGSTPPDGVSRSFFFPIWLLLCVWLLLPLLSMLGILTRSRRRRTGRCPTCGYSLTGNTSGTCPECGTAILPSGGRARAYS